MDPLLNQGCPGNGGYREGGVKQCLLCFSFYCKGQPSAIGGKTGNLEKENIFFAKENPVRDHLSWTSTDPQRLMEYTHKSWGSWWMLLISHSLSSTGHGEQVRCQGTREKPESLQSSKRTRRMPRESTNPPVSPSSLERWGHSECHFQEKGW